jgi:type IV pilus assembly protein PilN
MSDLICINLLDWRAAEREARRRRFLSALAGPALATMVLVGLLPMLYYNHLIAAQTVRNNYLQRQIATANHQLGEIRALKKTRAQLIDRMRVIETLQRSRAAIVHYFDQLVATIPDGVYLTALTQKGKTTTLEGVADANARVSQYMVNLDASRWFTNPRLIVIQRTKRGGHRYANFTLKVDSINPNAPETAAAKTTAGSRKRP